MKPEAKKQEHQSNAGMMAEPAKFLRDLLIERKSKNVAYSVRALARDLGVSHPFLSQVMNGKRNLSLEQKLRIAQKLGIRISQGNQQQNKNIEFEIIQQTLEHEKILKHWYHFAIVEMTATGKLLNSARTISQRLCISEVEVKTAIERLIEFGYLKIEKNFLLRTQSPFFLATDRTSGALREYHQSRLLAGFEELTHFDKSRVEQRHFQTLFIPSSSKKVNEAKKLVTVFQKKLISFLMQEEPDEVFQLSLQLFSVENQNLKSNSKKGGRE